MELTIRREKKHMISSKMIHMYCHAHHNTDKQSLCDHCQAISDYSEFRTSKCPYIAKTLYCINCPTPCYKPDMKKEMAVIMKYAGPRFLFKHPIYFIDHVITDFKTRGRKK